MASFIVDPEAVNRFKSKINYAEIVSKLPDDTLGVFLDWEDTLLHLLPDVWEVGDINTTISARIPYHAETGLRYENDEAFIDLSVRLFTDLSNKEVLDLALVKMSYTSMMEINSEYDKNGPCDVFFYYPGLDDSNMISDAICVFRNVIIEVETLSEDIDVRPILATPHNRMKASLVYTSGVKPSIVSCNTSAEEISVDQEFIVEIILPVDKPYIAKLHHTYGDNFEYLGSDKQRFSFRAKQQGIHEVSFSVLDTKNLYTIDVIRSIKVE